MSGPQMSSAANLYQSVINDVITSVRESFLDESVDENVLLELKNLWVQVRDLQTRYLLKHMYLETCPALQCLFAETGGVESNRACPCIGCLCT